MSSKRRKKLISSKGAERILRFVLFFGLGLSVYWGILLVVFATMRFFDQINFANIIFYLLTLMLPFFALLNLKFYIDVAKKEKFTKRWAKWFKEMDDEILFAVGLTFVFELLTAAFINNLITFSEGFAPLFSVLILPTVFAQFLMVPIETGTDQYLPFLSFVNELGILVGVAFQLIAFYYLSKFIFWCAHIHPRKIR